MNLSKKSLLVIFLSVTLVNATDKVKSSTPSKKKLTQKSLSCDGKYYCGEMSSCSEAYFYMNECGLDRLDGDSDGIPCEKLCGN